MIHVSTINTSESRRSSLVEIQEESEEDSSNTDNSNGCNGSTGFEGNSRTHVSKESNKTDDIATNAFQTTEDEKKCFSKPKSILKNPEKLRRGSTP